MIGSVMHDYEISRRGGRRFDGGRVGSGNSGEDNSSAIYFDVLTRLIVRHFD